MRTNNEHLSINITYNFLFGKKANGEYNHILTINKNGKANPLYNKEIYIPKIERDRDVLFQSLGYIGCYANNYFDPTIDYIFLPDCTVDNFQFGIKDDFIKWIEFTCEEQKRKSKDPKRWRFNMTFILENEVVDFIKQRATRVEENCILELIDKY